MSKNINSSVESVLAESVAAARKINQPVSRSTILSRIAAVYLKKGLLDSFNS
jgi:hypothetical protein